MSFVDIHGHWLPGIDDGAPAYGIVMDMLRLAHRGGTRALVATPHMFLPPYDNNDVAEVTARFNATSQELWRRSHLEEFAFLQELTLHLGSENYLSPEFLAALDHRRVLTLAGSRYLMLECPPYLAFEMLLSALDRIAVAGYVPVLAHVERYTPFLEKPRRLAEIVRRGCIAQVNGGCFLQSAESSQRQIALAFLRDGLAQVIASDAHDSQRRTPDLRAVAEVLKEEFPANWIQAWMSDNPKRLLNNQDLV